jgi:hypothetical protein
MTTRLRLSIAIAAATAAVLAVPGGASAASAGHPACAKKLVVREARNCHRRNLHEARRRYTPPKKHGKGHYRLSAARRSVSTRSVKLHAARRTYWHHR